MVSHVREIVILTLVEVLVVVVLGGALVGVIMLYNGLVRMRQLTKNAWADVDVYLKRRAELIPNIVTAVKAYASHEATLFEAIATARSQALGAGSQTERADAEGKLGTAIHRALFLAEQYPELRASDNFLNLQRELSETESKIASARQYYNACVRDLNTKVEAFPSSLVAGVAGVKHGEYFEIEDPEQREVPSV